LALARANLPGLRCSSSHLVTDKRIEHLAVSGERGFEPFPDPRFLMCGIEGDRSHGAPRESNPHDVQTTP
jgi:hypothetical protein